MEYDHSGRQPQWKETSMGENLNGRGTQLKTTSIEGNLNERQPQ